MRQPLKRDDFSDLLSAQGFSKPASGPRTLKDMKKEDEIEGSIDPDRARVCLTPHWQLTKTVLVEGKFMYSGYCTLVIEYV